MPTVEKKINCDVRETIDSSAKEQEFRNRSMFMFKTEESKAASKKERLMEHLVFINDFYEGLHIQTRAIASVHRIGRYGEGKSRPIKVLFNHMSDLTRVLINLAT